MNCKHVFVDYQCEKCGKGQILDDKDVFEPTITAEAVRADINEWKATLMFRPQFKTSIIMALENLEKLIIARTTREGV